MSREGFPPNQQEVVVRFEAKKPADALSFDELDTLCDEIDSALETQPIQLTSRDFSQFLYDQYTGSRGNQIERMHPAYIREYVMPTYQNEFLGRLKSIRAIDLEGLETRPILEDEEEARNLEEEINATLQKIEEEKIQIIEQQILQLAEQESPDTYWTAVEISQKLATLRTMFDGLLACTDRRLFDNFENPEIGQYFFILKSKISALARQIREHKRKFSSEVLPAKECQGIIKSAPSDEEGIKHANIGLQRQIELLVASKFSENQNQRYVATQLLEDVFDVVKESGELSKKDEWKMLVLQLPRKFSEWRDYKTLARRNQNYTGGGIANIALADEFIRVGHGADLFAEAESFLKETTATEHERGRDFFLKEIKAIYDSRRSVEALLASIEGRSEMLTPAEAMREVSVLTGAMQSGELERVLEIVERLESKTMDLYHETSDYSAYQKILEEGKMYAAWAARRYGDTFFGGGIYFWGAQQEDWMKGGSEALHVVCPVKDLFIIRNKYNNPNKGPFSGYGRYSSYGEDAFLHSQKKNNIIAMIPARALNIEQWRESPDRPLSNEGYTAETIADIEGYSREECNFIWRIDKHYGNYDTDYFISEEKEAQLRTCLGEGIKVERGVTAIGFGGGEYDRLIIPRSISILRATSIGYALRVPEIVYEDRLEALHEEEQETQTEVLEGCKQSINQLLEGRDPRVAGFVRNVADNERLPEKTRTLTAYCFAEMGDEVIESLQTQLAVVSGEIGGTLPTRDVLNGLVPKKEWFNRDSKIHGTPHIMRVLINAELLARLAKSEMPEGMSVNIKALEVAASMHDVKRSSDRSSDIWHGKRAAEFLAETADIFPELDEETRTLARGIMHNHALDDHDAMTPEEVIFKDADALDRFRFSSGPDWKYIRLQASQDIASISYALATISNFLLSNGYKRAEAVIDTLDALGLCRQETKEKITT